MRMLVLALLISFGTSFSLMGCASTDSDRAYGLRGNDAGQASYPKAPWGNNNTGFQGADTTR